MRDTSPRLSHQHTLVKLTLLFVLCGISLNAQAKPRIIVFAAASLTNAMQEVAHAYEATHPVDIKTSFASSSVLAKQIQRGAPADIYLSADQRWMNYLIKQRLIALKSRHNLLHNRLALIAAKPKHNKQQIASVQFKQDYDFSKQLQGKLCTGQVDTVPIGVYAKQALQSLHWWGPIKRQVVGVQNVRTALAYVERGECQVGIVYQTDAMLSSKVQPLGLFPQALHQPIFYPIGLTFNANNTAKGFVQFLWSDTARAIFAKYGFQTLAKHQQ